VEWGGTGVFPGRRRAQVAWLGVREGEEALTSLATALRRNLGRADEKPFQPHLTLVRFRHPPRSADLDPLLGGLDPLSWRHRVEAFRLVESRLEPDGAVYSERASFPLSGPR
jgi:2'-5' RNA ligase